ncbi:hypothetical protein EDD16DRAFT_1709376 [Pisolithus croceorrhizus]|nr:hypothetical protein EDD16DRAFT_1709376 [Pisolithus croceorrhizus]KAI6165411.1 hypothetical protein EDD17DRAFT_1754123 [Pisolithus thermaeus]
MALVQSPRPSLSTAREPFTSSGRGGSGNIRRTSVGRSSEPSVDVSDVVSLREKEGSSSRFVSVGRGGSGNIQPPSPDLADHPLTAAILSEHRDTEERYERQIRKRHEESKVVASSGRGGSGNISHNRRSKSRPPGSTSVRKGRRRTSETTTIDALHLINRESLSNITLADRGEGTSRSGAEPVDGPSCSPTAHNFQQRSTKKRNFLKIWKRSARPRSSISSLERISIADTTSNDVNQRDSDSSIDHLSLHRVSTSGHSGDTASTVSSYTSSGSRSLSSSHMSVQSLPTLPENREYVSFLDL